MLVLCAWSGPATATPYFPFIHGEQLHAIPMGPAPENQSVLLIVVDTFRPDHLGAYGYTRPTSPFLDSLAADGVVFANHFSNSTWTKPSIASLFTGLFPRRHNVLPITSKLTGSIATIAQSFKEAGYKTGAVVANSFSGRRYGLNRGFERFAEPSTHFNGKSPTASQLLNLALKWIAQDKDKPFFYTVFLFDPHDPYTPPPDYQRTFCSTCKTPEITTPWREYKGHGPTAKQIEDMEALYDGEIRYMDDTLKSFFDSLTAMGIRNRISTVVVGDHGEAFGEHKVFEHAFHAWDEIVRTPLIINSPRVSARGVYAGLTQHADVFPTLLALAGLPRPPGLQGMSLVQEPGQSPPPLSRLVISEVEMYGIHRIIVRDHMYKLIHHDPLDEVEFLHYYPDARIYPSVIRGTVKRELYDVYKDPKEQTDVYQAQRARALPLERALERYLVTGGLDEDASPPAPSEEVLRDLKSLGYIQ